MIHPFKGTYPRTQGFGENPQDYSRFGMLGHNGDDWGLPSGTEVLAAISGKVLEVADDPTGYGLYIKIENDTEGVLTAHLQRQDVSVGDNVDQGQHIGLSDNTGNSTGPHLHFGYYLKPRNRQNGYSGYIDPTPYYQSVIIAPTPDQMINDQTKVNMGEGFGELEIQQIRSMLHDNKATLESTGISNQNLTRDLADTQAKLADLQTKLTACENSKTCLHDPENGKTLLRLQIGGYLYQLTQIPQSEEPKP